jgi:3-phosphoshikimate 1-carboxyvinyltransferase
MTDSIIIKPCGPIHGSIRPPGSKSITNRALVCAALADGSSVLTGALDSEDTRVMIAGIRQLGIDVQASNDKQELRVTGCGGSIPNNTADLFIGNSGTTVRFLTAMATLGNGRYRLDGVPRMRQRPIADLITALNRLGANVKTELNTDSPPVIVDGHGLPGGHTNIAGSISSQYLSGILMAAPYAQSNVVLDVEGELVSKPYVTMTIRVMESFGATVRNDNFRCFSVDRNQSYQVRRYAIEPDASAASYFWAAAAITGGEVTVAGLSRDALQGDVKFCECLVQMGCDVQYGADSISVTGRPLRGIDIDMNPISDTVQTLAAVAVFADGPTRIRGVDHIRHKETDRIGDLVTELRKLGVDARETDDGLRIQPASLNGASIETYDDHRMAMSLALVGLRQPGVEILNPNCTAKTYPLFFDDLRALTGV